jgi:hypothetical protein
MRKRCDCNWCRYLTMAAWIHDDTWDEDTRTVEG